MTKNIENQSCILIQFTEESNEEFVGLEEWIQDENLEEFFFDNLEKEPKIIKVKWPESFQKLEMKSYLNNPEKHEWLKNKIGSLRSRGTWINMIEKQKTNKKYGTYESERNKRKIYTKKNYDSEDEEKENEEDKIKRKKKIENQLINPTAVAKKKKTDFCKVPSSSLNINNDEQSNNSNPKQKPALFQNTLTSNVTMVNAEHDPQLSCLTPITSIENLSTQTKTSTIQPASFLSEPTLENTPENIQQTQWTDSTTISHLNSSTQFKNLNFGSKKFLSKPTLENTPENIQQTQWTDSTTISHLNSSTQFKNLNFGSKKFLSKPTSNVTMVNAEHPQSSCSTPITSIENLSTQTKNSSIQPALFLPKPNERDENRPFSHEVDGIQVGDNIDRSNPRVWTHLHGAVYIKQAKLRRLCLDGKAEKRNLARSVSRQLMNMLVPRDVLAVHSLSGTSIPALPDKPPLPRIDSRITEAIFQYIKKEIMPNAVRADCNAGITGICADAAKTCRRRRNRNAN
ncbi:hypothetical protein HCN44_007721 [Aphidius gifuensis]|uniref:BEN domain-containing protein n=1 Tax=Aphidius gifuensis TaxID=684658 RepID=A0A834XQU1_APHGI|nr:hypothetical protein HCN44_007721 [Aphidius gifuensis]